MQLRNFTTVIVVMFLALVAAGANAQRQPEIAIDYVNETWPRPDSKQLTGDQVRQAIRAAIAEHKAERGYPWQVEPASDGNLLASTTVRNKHTVRVAISNTATTFSVVYNSSVNMKATKDPSSTATMIHPFYNRWVGDLVKAIKDELSRA
jgi:hypothetical protein